MFIFAVTARKGELTYSMRATIVLASPMYLKDFPMDKQNIFMQLECCKYYSPLLKSRLRFFTINLS